MLLHDAMGYKILPLFLLNLCLLISPVIVGIVFYNINSLPLLIWSLIPVVEYVLGFIYSKKGHLQSLRADCKKDKIKMPSDNVLILLYLLFGVFMASLNIVIMSVTTQPSILLGAFIKTTNITKYVFLMMYMVIYWISISMVIANNLFIFALTFRKHILDLKMLQSEIETRLIWHMKKDSMNYLMIRITNIRYVLNNSIDCLESFYTTSTIIGAIAIGPMINFNIWEPYCLYYLSFYVIIQIIFMYFIYRISSLKSDITHLVRSPNIMSRYLNLINNTKNNQPRHVHFNDESFLGSGRSPAATPLAYHDSQINQVVVESPRLRSALRNGLPRIVAHRSSDDTHESSERARYFPSDTSSIPLRTGIQYAHGDNLPGLYNQGNGSYNAGLYNSIEANTSNIEKLERYCPDTFPSFKSQKELEKDQITVMEYKTLASIDWIILHQILSESWADFSLLGISFGDTSVIQKGIGMTSAIIIASSYITTAF